MRGHPTDANACARTMPPALRRVHRGDVDAGASAPRPPVAPVRRRAPQRSLARQIAHVDELDATRLATIVARAAAVEPDAPHRIFRLRTETQQLADDALDRLLRDVVEVFRDEGRLGIRPHPVAILRPHAPAHLVAVVAEVHEGPRLHGTVEADQGVLVGRIRTVRGAIAEVARGDAVAGAADGGRALVAATRARLAVRIGPARRRARHQGRDRLTAEERIGIARESSGAQARAVIAPAVGRARASIARRPERIVDRQVDEAGRQPQPGEADDTASEHARSIADRRGDARPAADW